MLIGSPFLIGARIKWTSDVDLNIFIDTFLQYSWILFPEEPFVTARINNGQASENERPLFTFRDIITSHSRYRQGVCNVIRKLELKNAKATTLWRRVDRFIMIGCKRNPFLYAWLHLVALSVMYYIILSHRSLANNN